MWTMCVWERESERGREKGTEKKRERKRVGACVYVCVSSNTGGPRSIQQMKIRWQLLGSPNPDDAHGKPNTCRLPQKRMLPSQLAHTQRACILCCCIQLVEHTVFIERVELQWYPPTAPNNIERHADFCVCVFLSTSLVIQSRWHCRIERI